MQLLPSLTPLLGDYDGYILDLWGVVHDGVRPYPGAEAALRALHEQGKQVVFLSNAPRKAEKAEGTLTRLGIPRSWYHSIVTSGQTAHDFLERDRSLGERYFYLGPEKDCDVLADLDYEQVSWQKADFVLNAGFEFDFQPEAEILPLLEKLCGQGLLLVCINPDMEVVYQTGERLLCAGHVANTYAAIGGRVQYFGKPYEAVYHECFQRFGDIPKSRLLAVGDNLHTDILGAQTAGLDNVLVAGGILKAQLGEPHESGFEARLRSLASTAKAAPRFVVGGLSV